ncbi:hypothetical protein GCM10022381_27120 [Leifsonia kafniensis]|uniref:Lipoprotein n=1 Tax=Leifsonia kafniensis TaxID=475957 RepID=A0ABP7KNY0_9MICO
MRSRATSAFLVLGIASALLLAACGTGAPGPSPVPPSATSSETASAPVAGGTPAPAPSLGQPGAAGCAPASPTALDPASGFTEVQGTAPAGNSVYGLIMSPFPLAASNTTSKFVWRITGSGDLTVKVKRPDGSTGELAWGPDDHEDSTYNRPGDEWGTGIILKDPGCWELNFERAGVQSTVYLVVGPAAPTAG